MSQVLLIHPPVSFDKNIISGYDNMPPLGILYLAAVLEKENINVSVIDDIDNAYSIDDIIKIIKREKPRIVGISATTCQIKSSIKIVGVIREKFGKDIQICIGGCHFSADSTLIERYKELDFGVVGEGEITFPILIKKILKGEKIKGIFLGEPILDLDILPYPAFHLVDMERYKKRGMIGYPIIATRGCHMKCSFCSRPGMGGFGRLVRSRSGKNIVDEMEQVFDKYCGKFNFIDDSFTSNKEKVIEFCKEILKRKLRPSFIAGGVRIDKVDEDLIEIMVKAGCQSFCFGIESGSERIRNLIIHKGIWDNQIFKALKTCDRYSLDVQISLIVGFPTETREEMEETVMFPKKLIDMGIKCIEYAAIRPAIPFPGADLFTQAIKEKKIPKDIIDQYIKGKLGEGFRDNWPVYVPDGFTKEEMNKLRSKGVRAFYFSPYYIKRRIKKDLFSWQAIKKDILEVTSIIFSGRSRASFS